MSEENQRGYVTFNHVYIRSTYMESIKKDEATLEDLLDDLYEIN